MLPKPLRRSNLKNYGDLIEKREKLQTRIYGDCNIRSLRPMQFIFILNKREGNTRSGDP